MAAGDEPPEQTTSELRIEQAQREETEERLVESSESDNEAQQHERRASKAGYLRKKLEERERAEREAED